ncbi:glucose-1-phosphate cytidylyltransferase [Alphaproteobacteria bacterium]|nr:glucose-1-phosphate cytidylyltransferase [Alphaproteobacteria bacterium]
MKAVILAGGLGTRLSEETDIKPKPMVEIGGRPILWHIMKIYSSHGVNDFVICCGYKGYVIKEYFANYFLHHSDITLDIKNNSIKVHENNAEPWTVSLIDTGKKTMTGGRLKRVWEHVKNEAAFCFTYGDGVGNIDIAAQIKFHREHGRMATITATRPPGRYGALEIDNNNEVSLFREKIEGENSWINGGFFILDPNVINRIENDETAWEGKILSSLARDGELKAFKHSGFWQPMDTLREKNLLNDLWSRGEAAWKTWE